MNGKTEQINTEPKMEWANKWWQKSETHTHEERKRKKCQIESMIMQNVEHDFFLFHSSIWKLNVKLNKFTTHPLRTEKTEQKKICLKTKLFSMWINEKSRAKS